MKQKFKLKVCGMGSSKNILEVAALQPDYLGFIFYEKSSRNFKGVLPSLDTRIKKTAVFVDASFEFVRDKVREFDFQAVQLHGKESPLFCERVKSLGVEVFKVFSVKSDFDFSLLQPYEKAVDYFLFDTKGNHPGGNGTTFDWTVLKGYPSKTPFILSGGIGLEENAALKELLKTDLPIYAVDVNSKFEIAPALKDVKKLSEFVKIIQ
jgi:phosphoribosylanthranilate isomerase